MPATQTMDPAPTDGTGPFLRVYRREWVVMHTMTTLSAVTSEAVVTQLQTVGTKRFPGVSPVESRIEVERRGRYVTGRLSLLVPVCRGEFRYRADAENMASCWPESEVVITERDSPYDRDCQQQIRR